jgi:hypothetical protein
MDEHPLTRTSDGDGDRLHQRAAISGAVAGGLIDVATPQTVRTMVPMSGPDRPGRNIETAMPAAERLGSSSITAV